MKNTDGSLCSDCELFEHFCKYDDAGCDETCFSTNTDVQVMFCTTNKSILECVGFKSYTEVTK